MVSNDDRRRASIRMAVGLALIALAIFVVFIWMTGSGRL